MLIHVDLGTGKARREDLDSSLRRDFLGGSGVNSSLLFDLARPGVKPLDPENPLIVGIGSMVSAGVPTAARATFTSTGPLTGLFCDASTGGSLGLRLARVGVEHLVLTGKAKKPSVLVLREGGAVEIHPAEDLWGKDPEECDQILAERFGNCVTARIGRAGENLVRYAGIISSRTRPSMCGRGGLGAVMGSKNLKAIVVVGEPPPAQHDESLVQALLDSPRLEMRAQRGTLDLLQAYSAMQDLRQKNFSENVEVDAEKIHAEHAEGKTGCNGCPTPCGVRYESVDLDKGKRAEFGAVYALGVNLGLEFKNILRLLEEVDRLGMDAIEMGVVLGVAGEIQKKGKLPVDSAPIYANTDTCLKLIRETAYRRGLGVYLAEGAAWFAEHCGLPELAPHAKGQGSRPEKNLAAVLGQAVSTRGGDHMRSFPFLLFGGGEQKLLDELAGPFESEEAFHPELPFGKGRIVRWHENFKTAVDASGFCVFSAAALLQDRLFKPDDLAALMPVDPSMTFAEFFRGGERIVQIQRAFNALRGAAREADLPPWSRESLERPGMLDEYYHVRGFSSEGLPTRNALTFLGLSVVASELEKNKRLGADPAPYSIPRPSVTMGKTTTTARKPSKKLMNITIRAIGPLAEALGGSSAHFQLTEGSCLGDLVNLMGETRPSANRFLWRHGEPGAHFFRDGRALLPTDHLNEGDKLDLLVAVAGG